MGRKPLWNPIGARATVIGGLVGGIVLASLTSVIYGSWWYLLLALPIAAAWWIYWPRYYPKAYERWRRRLSRPKQ